MVPCIPAEYNVGKSRYQSKLARGPATNTPLVVSDCGKKARLPYRTIRIATLVAGVTTVDDDVGTGHEA
jgi:hypothetical protein